MRVQLPEGIATGGGTTKFRDVFVEPGTNARRLFRKNDQAAISTPWSDAPAELGIAGDGGAGNPAGPALPWFFSRTQVNLDLFDVVRNVVGPLSYGFSFYKIMPQLGGPAPVDPARRDQRRLPARGPDAGREHAQAVALQQAGRHVLVAGDLNDFEFSSALGRLAQGNTLTNLWGKAPANLAYSYKFNGHLQTLDHIFVTAGLESRVTDMRYVHFDNDYYERNPLERPNPSPVDGTGISDHDPPVATFELLPTSTSTTGTISGNVPATLSLTLGTAPPLGPFTPGVARDYTDDDDRDGHVDRRGRRAQRAGPEQPRSRPALNGTYALRAPLQIATNGGAFTPLRTDNGPLALAA